uniref:Putative transposon ty3-g gag-pol polyprotein n=1 Tax=Ixodes ricinus TaxID=34613 RepID=A0A6B0V6W4_IXORI
MSASTVIAALRTLFATHGLPDVLVSDNGTAFTSGDFKEFLRRNGIRQVLPAPYHPSSNAQAERMVQEIKKSPKKIIRGDWSTRLARFLFDHHILPSASTGRSPAELLFGRQIRSALDHLHPDQQAAVTRRQEEAFEASNRQAARQFKPGSQVFAINFGTSGNRWLPGVISCRLGPLSYQVQLEDGRVWRRHIHHIRTRHCSMPSDSPSHSYEVQIPDTGSTTSSPNVDPDVRLAAAPTADQGTEQHQAGQSTSTSYLPNPGAAPSGRPQREHHRPGYPREQI